MSIRILIADDHGLLRAGIRALLNAEADLEVVGEAGDTEEAVRLASELRPNIVLMDINMPGNGGVQATRKLRESFPEVRVLILTFHEDESFLREAISAGAAGYIVKRAVEAELISAIRAVSRGYLYVHPAMTHLLLKDIASQPAIEIEGLEPLTPREVEVLKLIALGHTNRQVGELLNLSVRTVESHRENLMGKLNLHSRVDIVRYASQRGLLDP